MRVLKRFCAMLLSLIMIVSVAMMPLGEVFAADENTTEKVSADEPLIFNGHSYRVYVAICESWEDAKEYCEFVGGHLATITSQEENDALYSYVSSLGQLNVYFGYSDSVKEGSWQWVNSEESSYTNWAKGEPNAKNEENYAQFYQRYTTGQWNDATFGADIEEEKAFLCEWDYVFPRENGITQPLVFNGHSYGVFDSVCETMEEAKEYCEMQGGYLATISSKEENDALYSYVVSKGYLNAYFGYTDSQEEDVWKWMNGESSTYTNWASGEPNNNNIGEDYAMLYWKCLKGEWNDGNFGNGTNGDEKVFICEWDREIKNDCQMSIKIEDEMTREPIKDCIISLDGIEDVWTDKDGVAVLSIGNVENIMDKKVKIATTDYAPYEVAIDTMSLYAQNTIRLKNENILKTNPMKLSELKLGEITVQGPTIEYNGEKFPLFELEAGIDLSDWGLKKLEDLKDCNHIKVDYEEQTVEVMLGLKDSFEVDNETGWKETYEEFKEYKKSFVKNASLKQVKNRYDKIQGKLKKFDTKAGIECSGSLALYITFDYSSGELEFLEGGGVATLTSSFGFDVPAGSFFYATFNIEGEGTGTLAIKKEATGSVGLDVGVKLDITPSVGAGVKLISKKLLSAEMGLEATMGAELHLPANSLEEALLLTLSAQAYIKGRFLSFEWKNEEYDLGEAVTIYPTQSQKSSKTLSIGSDSYECIPRDYLANSRVSLMSLYDSVSTINEINTYPYSAPQLASLSDGRIFACWLKDDGSKSDYNRTTLYYSIYEDEVWSQPKPIDNSGKADFDAKISVDGNRVDILWQRATEEYTEEHTLEEMIQLTELVYVSFENDEFSETTVVTEETGRFERNYSIASENGTVSIAWMENNEDDFDSLTRNNTIYQRVKTNDNWGTVEVIESNIEYVDSVATGFISGKAVVSYCKLVGENYDLYIDSTDVTSDEGDENAVSYQNGKFYWLQDNELCCYEKDSISSSGIKFDDRAYVVEDDGAGATCVVFRGTNGYKKELYVSYESNGEYTSPVALTNYEAHISSYDVVLQDGNIWSLMNVDNFSDSDEEVFSTTDLLCVKFAKETDLQIGDYVSYDMDKVGVGKNVSFTVDVKNVGTSTVSKFQVDISTTDGTILNSKMVEKVIEPGEVTEATIEYTIPKGFSCSEFVFKIHHADETNLVDNSITEIVGKADMAVRLGAVEEDKIYVTIKNVGFASADECVAKIEYLGEERVTIDEIEIGTLKSKKAYYITCEIPEEYRRFEEYYDMSKFIVSVSTTSEETGYANNEKTLIATPSRVKAVSLDITQTNLCIGKTLTLNETISPANSIDQSVVWISDSTDIATVNENGVVTALSVGEAYITVITKDGDFSAKCLIRVVDHVYSDDWKVVKEPTETENGVISSYCLSCGEKTEKELDYLKIANATLALEDDITVNYKVNASLFEEQGYKDPYIKFKFNDEEVIVDEYRIVEDKYVFDFENVAARQMNDAIYATLYATYGDVEYASATREYSVATYCYNVLKRCSSEEYSKVRTLLVDTLNYGAAAQTYFNYNVNSLANSKLTEEQVAWGTSETIELKTVFDKEVAVVENPAVVWKGAGVNLQNSVLMRLRFETDDTEGLSIKFVGESGTEWVITSDMFDETTEGYYVCFDGLTAFQMKEPVYITAYRGTEAVSDTICYSIESYAYSKQNSTDENLKKLIDAMMKYGNSACAYQMR